MSHISALNDVGDVYVIGGHGVYEVCNYAVIFQCITECGADMSSGQQIYFLVTVFIQLSGPCLSSCQLSNLKKCGQNVTFMKIF